MNVPGTDTAPPLQPDSPPVVLSPRDGQTAGPNTDVTGRVAPGAVVVISTDVIRVDTGERLKTIAGIRRRAGADGSFTLHIATPRISGAEQIPLIYEVKVRTIDATGKTSAVTTISLNAIP